MISIRQAVVFSVTVVFFSLEAIMHYSIGKSSERRGGVGRIKLHFPSFADFRKILLVVIIFAALASATSAAIEGFFLEDE